MNSNSRETSLSFHRESAEREARLLADIERVFGTIEANRQHYDALQDRAFEELVRVLERRRFTDDEITDALNRQFGNGEY